MNAQEQEHAKDLGMSVQREERNPGDWSYWIYANGNQIGGPFKTEAEGWGIAVAFSKELEGNGTHFD